MKFLQILGYATLALAVPSPLALDDSVLAAEFAKRDDSIIFEGLQKRATVTSTLTNSVGTLQSVTASNIKAINSAVATIRASNNATVIVQATAVVRTSYRAIIAAVQAATAQITTGTTGAAGGIAGSIAGLTQQEVVQLTTAVQQAITTLTAIRATLTVTATNLSPAVITAISAETSALRALVQPFVAPITVLTQAIMAASVAAKLTVTGLSAAVVNLRTLAANIANSV